MEVSNEELQQASQDAQEFTTSLRGGDYSQHAAALLNFMQKRDYRHLSKQIDMAKDDIIKDTEFGRWALSIPSDHFEILKLMYPRLGDIDAKEKTKAWKAFMITAESLPYKINSKQRTM